MKLDHKRTVLVGLAFLSICAFWQMYDNIIPLILTNTFHLDETISGAIMAADNVLALFLLPFFGALSDRTSTKIGRRMPFILGGTAAAVILMNLLPLFDNGYANGASTGKLAMFVVTLGLYGLVYGETRYLVPWQFMMAPLYAAAASERIVSPLLARFAPALLPNPDVETCDVTCVSA